MTAPQTDRAAVSGARARRRSVCGNRECQRLIRIGNQIRRGPRGSWQHLVCRPGRDYDNNPRSKLTALGRIRGQPGGQAG
jgi:hypothetical protein